MITEEQDATMDIADVIDQEKHEARLEHVVTDDGPLVNPPGAEESVTGKSFYERSGLL